MFLDPSLCSGIIFKSGSSGSKPRIFWILINTANLYTKKVVPIYRQKMLYFYISNLNFANKMGKTWFSFHFLIL